MRDDNPAIDAFGETEVVRIHDQSLHCLVFRWLSVSFAGGSRICKWSAFSRAENSSAEIGAVRRSTDGRWDALRARPVRDCLQISLILTAAPWMLCVNK